MNTLTNREALLEAVDLLELLIEPADPNDENTKHAVAVKAKLVKMSKRKKL